MSLAWANHDVPLGFGLQQQADARALLEPALTICRDVEFRRHGGLQSRYPYAALGNAVAGGGTLTDLRSVFAAGDELLAFTKDALWSWSQRDAYWVRKATHLAVEVDHRQVFATTGDQVDADRAELAGVAVYCWIDAGKLWVAAEDTVTGAVLYGPAIKSSAASKPKLVATAGRIAWWWVEDVGGGVVALQQLWIDPGALASSIGGAAATRYSAVTTMSAINYDAAPVGDRCLFASRLAVTTSYRVGYVQENNTASSADKVRGCNGPIAIAPHPNGTHCQVVRANYVIGSTTPIEGDYLQITGLVDVYTGQAIGTGGSQINQITASYVAGRCWVFWTSNESTGGGTSYQTEVAYVDDSNVTGGESTLVRLVSLVSRAFTHDGAAYVWLVFAGESNFSGVSSSNFRSALQTSYFLYRADGLLIAKAVAASGGGLCPSMGRLPSVQSLGGGRWAWAAAERRKIALGGQDHSGFGARSPCMVTATFDSAGARRCAMLGRTVYVAAGEVLQYDGSSLFEVGFHVFPWQFGAIELPPGTLPAGKTYAVKSTLRWDNARGETERSTTATVGTLTTTAPNVGINFPQMVPTTVTHKTQDRPAFELWRTLADQTTRGAAFYLLTSKDPSVTTGSNRYVANDHTAGSIIPAFHDQLDDAAVGQREVNDEIGLALAAVAPPAARLVLASDERLFLAGMAGDQTAIWYSMLRDQGEIASFSDALAVRLPTSTGKITALSWNGETLAVFAERAVYALDGAGFDNAGGGAQYVPRLVDTIGAESQEAVCSTEQGVVFRSAGGGWRLLSRGWSVEDIGGPVRDYDAEAVVGAAYVAERRQVRVLTSQRALVFDLRAQQWSEWSVTGALGSVLWRGAHGVLFAGGLQLEQASHAAAAHGVDVQTAWIRPSARQGECRVRKIQISGSYVGACALRVRLSYDDVDTVVDDHRIAVQDSGGRVLVQIGPRRQLLTSIKVRVTVEHPSTAGAPPSATEGVRLSGLTFEVGTKPGMQRRAAQKA